jgi:hypothetical protein
MLWPVQWPVNFITIVTYDSNDSMLVIYYHNNSRQYYKTMILSNLALTRGINYDRKGTLQTEAYITIVI